MVGGGKDVLGKGVGKGLLSLCLVFFLQIKVLCRSYPARSWL